MRRGAFSNDVSHKHGRDNILLGEVDEAGCLIRRARCPPFPEAGRPLTAVGESTRRNYFGAPSVLPSLIDSFLMSSFAACTSISS